MPVSGVTVNQACIDKFNELKGRKGVKYIIYKISEDGKEIVLDDFGNDSEFDVFREKVMSKKVGEKSRPSYCVYDIEYELGAGEGKRSKVAFITFVNQDATPVKLRMLYASSKETLKNTLSGIQFETQCNDPGEFEWEEIRSNASKGKAI